MSDNGDVNDFEDVEEPDVGEDPFGGSDLEPVTDDEDEEGLDSLCAAVALLASIARRRPLPPLPSSS